MLNFKFSSSAVVDGTCSLNSSRSDAYTSYTQEKKTVIFCITTCACKQPKDNINIFFFKKGCFATGLCFSPMHSYLLYIYISLNDNISLMGDIHLFSFDDILPYTLYYSNNTNDLRVRHLNRGSDRFQKVLKVPISF